MGPRAVALLAPGLAGLSGAVGFEEGQPGEQEVVCALHDEVVCTLNYGGVKLSVLSMMRLSVLSITEASVLSMRRSSGLSDKRFIRVDAFISAQVQRRAKFEILC